MHNQKKYATEANAAKIFKLLKGRYGQPKPALRYRSCFQLAVAVILSAQTTDVAVNKVTPELFARYGTATKMAKAKSSEIKQIINTVGLAPGKSRYLAEMSRMLVMLHRGRVPDDRASLMALPGVGRKSANVILSVGFGIPAFAVDTHVGRLCRRLGLTKATDPNKVEKDVTVLIKSEKWLMAHLLLIQHGRDICFARKPNCPACPLTELCPSIETV
jgi:endonuclease III